MASRLTDEKKKKIIADYAETGSYRATAKKFGVSDMTVKRLCESDVELLQKVAQKKEQNTAEILDYLESKKRQGERCLRRLHRSTEKARENTSGEAVRDCYCYGDCDR